MPSFLRIHFFASIFLGSIISTALTESTSNLNQETTVSLTGEAPEVNSSIDEIKHDSSKQITANEITSIAGSSGQCKKQNKVAIGVDGSFSNKSNLNQVASLVKNNSCATLHVYDQGPGGVTGTSGYQLQELDEMKKGASKCGLKIPKDIKKYQEGCYKKLLKEKAENNCKLGAKSMEIDNLENDPSIGENNGPGLVAFVKEFQSMNSSNLKLLLKNRSSSQLEAIGKAIETGILKKDWFIPITVVEETVSGKDKIKSAAAVLGFKTVCSRDTNNYKFDSTKDSCSSSGAINVASKRQK